MKPNLNFYFQCKFFLYKFIQYKACTLRDVRGGVYVVKVRTKDIIEKFGLELISGEEGINRPIITSDISRPGIE